MAESDPLLETGFFESGVYPLVQSRHLPHCMFLVGRTGSGKSALLKHLEESRPEHVIRIIPENLLLAHISNSPAIRTMAELGMHPDPFFTALWKHVLVVEVLKHRYSVTSPEVKQTVFRTLLEAVKRDERKKRALEYLERYGSSFWCDTDERVREIWDHIETQLSFDVAPQVAVPPALSIGPRVDYERLKSHDERVEITQRYQKLVDEAQIAQLNEMLTVLDDDVLKSDQQFTYVIIDDLDKDWVENKTSNDLLRCLLRTLWEMQRMKHLKVIVALRTNIFDYLDFGSAMGGQEEKYRALARHITWTSGDLERMADERTKAAGEMWKVAGGLQSIRQILPQSGRRRGDPFAYMIERTLMRPRDFISYTNACLRRSGGRPIVWRDITDAEAEYSRNRYLALRDEWKPTFPGILDVLEVFRGAVHPISAEAMLDLVIEIGMLIERPMYPGTLWLSPLVEGLWVSHATWADQYHPVLKLLFEIGLIGCKPKVGPTVYAHDQPDFAQSAMHLESCVAFEVHRAFRPALDIVEPGRHAQTIPIGNE